MLLIFCNNIQSKNFTTRELRDLGPYQERKGVENIGILLCDIIFLLL